MKTWRRAFVAGALLLAVLSCPGWTQQKTGERIKEFLALVGEVESGKDVSKQATALGKKFGGVRTTMNLYNSKAHGGIGFGVKGTGMEARLVALEEKGITDEVLKAEAKELKKLAQITVVMSDALRGYAPAKPFLGRGKKEWDGDLETMKSGAQELSKAIAANDPKAVKAAATRINNACNRCHDGVK